MRTAGAFKFNCHVGVAATDAGRRSYGDTLDAVAARRVGDIMIALDQHAGAVAERIKRAVEGDVREATGFECDVEVVPSADHPVAHVTIGLVDEDGAAWPGTVPERIAALACDAIRAWLEDAASSRGHWVPVVRADVGADVAAGQTPTRGAAREGMMAQDPDGRPKADGRRWYQRPVIWIAGLITLVVVGGILASVVLVGD